MEEYKDYFRHITNTRKIDPEIWKREAALNTYENWVEVFLNKEILSEYFEKKRYYHIAIYGMGRIGRQLLKEFRNSNICVDYIIDQKLSEQAQYYETLPCLNIKVEFPYVNLIIVTVSSEADKIIDELRKKTDCLVKSIDDTIDDILFVAG